MKCKQATSPETICLHDWIVVQTSAGPVRICTICSAVEKQRWVKNTQ